MKLDEALALIDARSRFGQRMGLEQMRGMLAELGDFHESLHVVHVAGTNGKGSVCALVASALQAAGHRTGLYTSPHLVRFHERIRIGGADISGEELARAMERVRPALDKFPEATYFEVATLVALRHFVDAGCDVVVLETGLGGRLDATNVFARPVATVVTNVSLEHTEVLGKDVASVAREKGGIIKPGVPLVTGATGEALDVLRAIARERGAPVRALGDDFIPIGVEEHEGDGQSFDVSGLREYGTLTIPFRGEHQLENAALALATLDTLDAAEGAGLAVPVDAVRAGFPSTRWAGRLQEIPGGPGRPRILLDGAHNPAGAEALARYLRDHGLRPVLLFGALADKDWLAMVETLAPHVRDAIATRVPSSRTLEPMESARHFSRMNVFGMVVEEPGHALKTAMGLAGEGGLLLVTGSLYLVGDALARLDKRA